MSGGDPVARPAGGVHFRVLGPFDFRLEGRSVPVSAPKLKVVLASLVLQPGRVVPVETLIERIWDTSPPSGARQALQTAVLRLRRVLGVEGLVQTRPGGYAIELPPGGSDLQEFTALTDAARSALAHGDSGAALTALRRATALWHGPILFDVESASLQREEVPRLLERCLAAVEQRFELELATGHHDDIVGELRRLSAEHPLRETLRAHLMRALYRSGRRAEALEVYQDTRKVLRAELGLEPGHDLRSLQRTILLGHDEQREAPRDVAPYQVLCQLPPSTTDFVGRADDLARLESHLAGGAAVPIALVNGVAGVGKSALAVHVAHRLRSRFPDGQLYVNLEGAGAAPRDPAEVLGEFLLALGHPPAALPPNVSARAAAFRARLADRRVLLLLDDAADAAQIEPLLPGTPGSAVLVTSRRSLPELPGVHRHRLQPLSVEEGVMLLSELVDGPGVLGQREVAEDLVGLCGGLPLAVRILGGRLAQQSTAGLRALADRLRSDRHRLDELSIGRLDIRAELAMAYAGLPAPVQAAFRRIGLLPSGPFAAWSLGVLCGDGDGERLAEQLTAAGLLETVGVDLTGRPRYRPHDLVGLYARELGAQESDDVRRSALRRLLRTLVRVALEVHPRLTRVSEGLPPVDRPVAVPAVDLDVTSLTRYPDAWVHAERSLLLHTIEQSCRFGWYEEAAVLADIVVPALAVRGGFEQLERCRAAIAAAATAAGDEYVAARAESSRADLRLSVRVDEAGAAFERCVPVFRRLGRDRELVHSLTGLAFARIWQGLDGTAHAREATRIAYTTGDPESVVLALRTHAETLIADQPQEALRLLEEALPRARELDNAEMQRTILARMTDCAITLGDLATADQTYAQALALTDAVTNTQGLAWLLMHHSRLQLARGDHAAAMAEARQARELMDESGDTRGVVTASLRLAEAMVAAGDAAAAGELVRSTLAGLDATAVPRLRRRAERFLAEVSR